MAGRISAGQWLVESQPGNGWSHLGQATAGAISPRPQARRTRLLLWSEMNTLWSAVIGWFFGFGFGVGCALAVMYSIYMGGYRAALRDSRLPSPPERLTRTLARLDTKRSMGH